MTLISFTNSEGRRRCDAKCYLAKCTECDCICGGLNHGAGHAQALINTRTFAEKLLADAPGAKIEQAVLQAELL